MFSVCPHLQGGGGVPQPGPVGGGGAYPGQVQLGGLLQPGPARGGPQAVYSPWSGQDRGGGGGTPAGKGQEMEYLIRHSRYASCVHAGGLSCFGWEMGRRVHLRKKI